MFFIVYETVNKINGKKYRGVHKTKNLNDGYLGSGKNIIRAIKKYGEENFEKIILKMCNTEQEMYDVEKIFVNEDWIQSSNTYNIMVGGRGGWGHIDVSGENNPFYGKNHSEETKEKMRKEKIGKFSGEKNPMCGIRLTGETNGMYGKMHTKDSREKISKTRKEKIDCGEIDLNYLNNPKSDVHREKLSISAKRRWENPEERKKASITAKKRKPISRKTRKKMSESQKRRWENHV